MIELSARLRRAGDVRYRMIDDEGVVIRQSSSEILILNDVGARVLDLLDGQRSVGTIVESLLAEYEVEKAELESDVVGFLDDLLLAGVVEPSAEPST